MQISSSLKESIDEFGSTNSRSGLKIKLYLTTPFLALRVEDDDETSDVERRTTYGTMNTLSPNQDEVHPRYIDTETPIEIHPYPASDLEVREEDRDSLREESEITREAEPI